MKKFLFMAALLCLLANAIPVNAQLIIRNSGHAEVGVNPSTTDTDTVTVLKLFGDTTANAPGARITFGDLGTTGCNVAVGEFGNTNTDQLWLHGGLGIYLTRNNGTGLDTIAFFDPARSSSFNYSSDLIAHGVFIQSDERFKEDVEPVGEVLGALMTLEPVTYSLKSHRAAAPVMMDGTKEAQVMDSYYRNLERGSERYGFLAQNVKDAFPELVHTDNNGYMSVDYIGLIPILVQSINELRAELAEVKGEQLNDEENPLMQTSALAAQSELEASLSSAKLYQNAPNPWDSQTVIRYSLPQDVAKADIYIYDMQGTQLKCIPAQGRGESQVTLTAHDLKAGMYIYALVADGTLIDSKQMILTK